MPGSICMRGSGTAPVPARRAAASHRLTARRLAPVALLACMLVWLPGAGPRAQANAEPPPPEDITAADLLDSLRSDVRIVARENHDVEEFRVGNKVHMIKVKPKGAPPYYLIDEDGSGELQWRRGPDLERTSVPHWSIIRW
jgi:hypothetical protein